MTREGDIGGNYGIRTERQLEALWALETSIASVADLFKDDSACNESQ